MRAESESEMHPSGQYRVVARQPQGKVREEFFKCRTEAERLMDMLVEQGFAVMMRQIHHNGTSRA